MNSQNIILVDAYAQIYRGFFAIRNLSNSKGLPVNAVFALAKFLIRLNRDYPIHYGAFTFDVGKPAFRLDILPEYKANRPPMPDELRNQIPFIHRLVEYFGWPSLSKEDYESDDLLAGIAGFFTEYPVLIVSGDKDIAQVIDDRVKMLVPDKKDGGLAVRGANEVMERYGVFPDQIPDLLALTGDSSDNIPGVPGVGPKTAAKLIAEFGSLSNLLQNITKLDNQKLREKILPCADILKKNLALITLKTELPDNSWKALSILERKTPDWQKILALCAELELKSIYREVENLMNALPFDVMKKTPVQESKKTAPEGFIPDLFG
ncbi:MAG: hypothetical protein A2020_02155 [Lentisphaerae bacterium GWF2_45_14]|nr:MAG: hypothetical protein A2020_02155 [Lentisphaerae bacterium GWF2_45_14]